jgi:hypothetical protein
MNGHGSVARLNLLVGPLLGRQVFFYDNSVRSGSW